MQSFALIGLCLLVFVPSGQAVGQASASALIHEGSVLHTGDLLLGSLHGDRDTPGSPGLFVEAAFLQGWRFASSGNGVSGATTVADVCTREDGSPSDTCRTHEYGSPNPLDDVRLSLASADAGYRVHVFTLEGQQAQLEARYEGGKEASVAKAALSPDGVAPSTAPEGVRDHDDDSEVDSETISFRRTLEMPSLVTQSEDAWSRVLVSGDFVLEIAGVNLQMTDDGDVSTIATRDVSNPLTPSAAAYSYEESLARFVLTGATLTFHGYGSGVDASWALANSKTVSEHGPLAVRDGYGQLQTSYGTLAMDGGVYYHDGGYDLSSEPSSQELTFDFTELDDDGRPMLTANTGAMDVPLVWAMAGLALLVVLAVLAGLMVRRAQPLSMSAIEAALAAEQYRRAASLSKRMIRKDPAGESARLSRAIAQSRIGQPRRVVRELASYLRRARPRDGTLHYVLGLAYRDLGDEDSSKIVFAEAIRLTPSLAAQIDEQPERAQTPGGHQAYV